MDGMSFETSLYEHVSRIKKLQLRTLERRC